MARFQPGQSGNPKGRPPKSAALRDLLSEALAQKIETPEGKIEARVALACLIRQAVTTGMVRFPGDKTVSTLSMRDWLEIVKWAYQYLEPPVTKLEHSGDPDNPVEVVHFYIPDNGRPHPGQGGGA